MIKFRKKSNEKVEIISKMNFFRNLNLKKKNEFFIEFLRNHLNHEIQKYANSKSQGSKIKTS